MPYRGLDESTRLVIGLGGTVLAVAAALLAFWPRRSELGLRNVALVLLVTLYVIPAVALDLSSEFLSGALLALLVVAYLRLERVRITDAGAAAMLAVAVTILGLAAAPALDTDEPGSTTRRGRCRAPPRSRRASPGITPTDRWTGRATAASCCA